MQLMVVIFNCKLSDFCSMINLEKLGYRIRVLRTEKKLSQENMANDLGISVTAYSKIERGKTNIPVLRLTQIADVLGVSISKIVQPEQENITDSILAKDSIRRYGEFDTISLVQRIYKLEDDMTQLQKMLTDKEEIIALLKEKLAGER